MSELIIIYPHRCDFSELHVFLKRIPRLLHDYDLSGTFRQRYGASFNPVLV